MAPRPHHAVKPDANQPAIVTELEARGFLVVNVSQLLATPDLFVRGETPEGFQYWTAWEIKTATGKLTPTQIAFQAQWPGAVQVARCAEDILREYGRI